MRAAEDTFAKFSTTLANDGVRAALAELLLLTDYRFIGIFRFQNGRAAAAVHYDREHPEVMNSDEVPDTATYCCFVRDSRGVFMTANAMLDSRTQTHPARDAVPAYCGVPIMDAEGTILGTLCHYDVVPRDVGQIDLALMVQVAATLAQGHVPPYPTRS